mgnify:CR=1 FL=1
MYQEHFGLHERPFSLTPDTQFFFNKRSHRDALNTLLLALRHSEGFVKISGEVGTGKTLLCRKLLNSLGDEYITAYIPNPYLTPDELKWFLASEIGVEYDKSVPAYKLLDDIYKRLLTLAQERRQVVLVVDEAQAMPRESIEALRLLTNLETEKRKLLQVVLLGQPELDEMLERPDLRQLKQRIVFSEVLKGFDLKDTRQYLAYRLASAGFSGRELFSPASSRLLYQASGGIPRLMNILAHKAMLAAYGRGDQSITRTHVISAIKDTGESRFHGRLSASGAAFFWPILGALSALAVVGVPRLMGVW